jgi:hypothetical protein
MLNRRFIVTFAAACLGSMLAWPALAKSMPYGGKPVLVPGIVQAENFDLGKTSTSVATTLATTRRTTSTTWASTA